MSSQEPLISSIQALADELRAHGVKNLWLFGSAARSESNPHDLDFLVEFVSPPTLTDFMNLKFFLEDRLRMPIDLHSRATCPERFFNRIQPDLLHVA